MTAPARNNTAVATIEPPVKTYALRSPVADALNKDNARAAIEPMLRPGESYDRVVVEVYHAAAKNPDILRCTPESVVSAVARAVGTGLLIGETVHLVPFGQKLEMVLDYKGAIQLVVTSGAARFVDAQCHYANEKFEYEQGSAPFIRHVPIVDPKARGALVGAYAFARIGRSDVRIVYMAVEEIDAIRLAKSKAWKTGPLSAIPWYAKKTVIKQLTKTLPKNPELAKVMALFEREDEEEDEASTFAELSSGLDPAKQIAAQETIGTAAGFDESDDLPFGDNPAPAAARQPLECELVKIPDGLGPRSGQTLGSLSNQDLDQLYRWAGKETGLRKYPDLKSQCEELLEMRRLGDAKEPQ